MHFLCGNSKNTSYKSCWPCRDAHLHQKWDHGSIVCYGTCTILGQPARSPRELLPGSTSLWKSSPVNPCHAMFGIFPRCYITHHDSMQCFSIFLNLFEFPGPHSRSRSNSCCLDVCQVGREPKFGVGFRVPHHQGTSMYFSHFLGVHFL
jgi:hypothetical protein